MDIYLKKAMEMFPDASCELIYHNPFEFLSEVMLSAQTTDKKVNMVSIKLFEKFPTFDSVKENDYDEIYEIIKPLGLAKGKTSNFIKLCLELQKRKTIPNNVADLVTLPGVGEKTAYVYMAEIYKEPHIAVDTHVSRVATRLGLSKEKDPLKISKDLERRYPKELYIKVHHTFLFLGRYKCKSLKPDCDSCLLKDIYQYKKSV
jgi:endonuclease-3